MGMRVPAVGDPPMLRARTTTPAVLAASWSAVAEGHRRCRGGLRPAEAAGYTARDCARRKAHRIAVMTR